MTEKEKIKPRSTARNHPAKSGGWGGGGCATREAQTQEHRQECLCHKKRWINRREARRLVGSRLRPGWLLFSSRRGRACLGRFLPCPDGRRGRRWCRPEKDSRLRCICG